MTRFAFVVHPITAKDVARKYPFAKVFPDSVIEAVLRLRKPEIVSEITGIESKTGATTNGFFVGLPLTPKQMIKTLPESEVYEKIIACTKLAAENGAKIIGLGAFSSVVGDGGITVASRSPIAVTTGNSYTVATAIQAVLKGCDLVGVNPEKSTLAVVGATGSIGKTCAVVLRKSFGKLILVGRNAIKIDRLSKEIGADSCSTDVATISEADVVVTVTSSEEAIILPQHLKPGAIICDVSRPRDVSVRVAKERPDVLVIEGGVVHVPGNVDFNFDFGFPAKTAYACMSETMILALEDRVENYTLGKDVSVQQVEEMAALAIKHGFDLAGFRSFEKLVSQEAIDRAIEARRVASTVEAPTILPSSQKLD